MLIPVGYLAHLCISLDIFNTITTYTIKADFNKNLPIMIQANTVFTILFVNDFKIYQPTVIVDVVDLFLSFELIKSVAVHDTNKPKSNRTFHVFGSHSLQCIFFSTYVMRQF